MTIQIAKTRPMKASARRIRDAIAKADIRSTWPLYDLADYTGIEMDQLEFIVTQMEMAGYLQKTHWGHYMLTRAGAMAT